MFETRHNVIHERTKHWAEEVKLPGNQAGQNVATHTDFLKVDLEQF